MEIEVPKFITFLTGGTHFKLTFPSKFRRKKKGFLHIHLHLALNISNVLILETWLSIAQMGY